MRVSQLITSSLGGRIVFGDPNKTLEEYSRFRPIQNRF